MLTSAEPTAHSYFRATRIIPAGVGHFHMPSGSARDQPTGTGAVTFLHITGNL